MKITKRQLFKLIKEAVYIPQKKVSQEELDYNALIRSKLTDDEKRKVDAMSNDPKAHTNLISNLYLGGGPVDKEQFDPVSFNPETVTKQDFEFPAGLGPGETSYGDFIEGNDPKDALIEMDEEMYRYVITRGQKILIGENMEDSYYILPIREIYKFMSSRGVSKDIIDFALDLSYEIILETIHGETYLKAVDY